MEPLFTKQMEFNLALREDLARHCCSIAGVRFVGIRYHRNGQPDDLIFQAFEAPGQPTPELSIPLCTATPLSISYKLADHRKGFRRRGVHEFVNELVGR